MKGFIADLINQLWTLLGMFVAWVVLEGSAKSVVGWLIIWTLVIWMVTYTIRKSSE